MNSQSPNSDVVIRRDDFRHSWMMRVAGAHETETPWRDTAPATSVVAWIRTNAGGPVNVKVQL